MAKVIRFSPYSMSPGRRRPADKGKLQRTTVTWVAWVPWTLTLIGLLIGLYQYFLSQVASDVRHFEQAYFTEKFDMYKRTSSEVSDLLVHMEADSVKSFRKIYARFKSSYWSIQLVKDSTYDKLLEVLDDFDSEAQRYPGLYAEVVAFDAKSRYKGKDKDKEGRLRQKLIDHKKLVRNIAKSLNESLNKLLLNERKQITSVSRMSVYLPWNWFGDSTTK